MDVGVLSGENFPALLEPADDDDEEGEEPPDDGPDLVTLPLGVYPADLLDL
jgi:hypothetical protein